VDARNETNVIETVEGLFRVPSDRATPEPYPRDLPAHSRARPQPIQQDEDDATDCVMERVIAHGQNKIGDLVVRVRWAGYGSSDDTWERPLDLPDAVLRRYECRKKLSRGTVSITRPCRSLCKSVCAGRRETLSEEACVRSERYEETRRGAKTPVVAPLPRKTFLS
jgi:hypothetical protein